MHYQTLVRYLGFKDEGMVLGAGCGTPEMTKSSKFPDLAYQLGLSLKLKLKKMPRFTFALSAGALNQRGNRSSTSQFIEK